MKQNGPTMKTKEPTTAEIQKQVDIYAPVPFMTTPPARLLYFCQTLLKRLEAAELWMGKATHLNHCMRLDPYDERDHGCTCGLEALLNRRNDYDNN